MEMETDTVEVQGTKRLREGAEQGRTIDSMFSFMKQEAEKRESDKNELAKKDAIILELNKTIASLQTEMAELREMIKKHLEAKEKA